MNVITKASSSDLGLLLLVAIVWASAFISFKVNVPEVGPLWLAAIRVVIGALTLVRICLYFMRSDGPSFAPTEPAQASSSK